MIELCRWYGVYSVVIREGHGAEAEISSALQLAQGL
jgi:hypothetical protein